MKDYLNKTWKTPSQLEADRQVTGKTREQLDREGEELRRQVEADLKIWNKSPNRGLDRAECVIIGLAIGCLLTVLCNGGCRLGVHIKSTPNDSQNQTAQ